MRVALTFNEKRGDHHDHAEFDTRDAIDAVEELVDGIDVAVGWIAGLGLFPPIRYRYDAIGRFAIYDYVLKHVSPERVQIEIPAVLPDGTGKRLERAATRVFDALGVTGYGRADFRVTPTGDVVFLEMNPLPSLTPAAGHDELYAAAARLGKTPPELLGLILDAAPRPRASHLSRCA